MSARASKTLPSALPPALQSDTAAEGEKPKPKSSSVLARAAVFSEQPASTKEAQPPSQPQATKLAADSRRAAFAGKLSGTLGRIKPGETNPFASLKRDAELAALAGTASAESASATEPAGSASADDSLADSTDATAGAELPASSAAAAMVHALKPKLAARRAQSKTVSFAAPPLPSATPATPSVASDSTAT